MNALSCVHVEHAASVPASQCTFSVKPRLADLGEAEAALHFGDAFFEAEVRELTYEKGKCIHGLLFCW